MDTVKKAFRSDHAKVYDRNAAAANWLDPAIVFGLAYRFVNPGDRLLDIGIGTGLSSALFHKAGLQIYGIDLSPEMLSRCRSKQMAVELKEHDLSRTPYPFDPGAMDHAVCTGVTHLFEDMGLIFQELSRILRPGGTFSFVVADCGDGENRTLQMTPRHHPGAKEVTFYCYSEAHIRKLLEGHQFKRLCCLEFRSSSIGNQPGTYRAYVVQKISDPTVCREQTET
jgi:ubiquinone/menaquinone biosynthesis C-methylase UbiE